MNKDLLNFLVPELKTPSSQHNSESHGPPAEPYRWRLVIPLLISLITLGSLFLVIQPGETIQASANTDVSGIIITDTTWLLSESPYIVTGDVILNPDIVLRIEPGVRVAFDGNYALIIRGTLDAQGTEAQPIRFTSNQATPAPGDWGVIDFRHDSLYSILEHTIIEYGGNESRPGDWCTPGVLCVSTSSFTLNDSTVQHNANRGLVLRQSEAVISNNSFDDHPNEAISLHYCNHSIGPCRPTIVGNTFTNNAYPIYRVDALDPYLAGNQASDNDLNGIVLKTPCKFTDENTWYAGDLTYVIEAGHCYVGGYGDTSLAIQPGTVVKFGSAGGLRIVSDNYFTATITATGTSDAPIIFTSLKDDSAGGDTNNDGSASSPGVGDWELMWIDGAKTQGVFENAQFLYGRAGGASWRYSFLVDYGATLEMKDSTLSHGEVGIKLFRGAHAEIQNTVISDMTTAGLLIDSDGEVQVTGGRFLDSGVGVYVSRGHPTVSDNFFQGNTTAVEVICTTQIGDCAPVISPHNSFADNQQQGIMIRYPVELCVNARNNWWGDKTGPQDDSSELDACDLVDNPGSGAITSDGVDYSPWDGGVARPLIARPGCGVTARNQPIFTGRAQDGAMVFFYDGETLLGQTTTAADHTFNWTPLAALSDGSHTITAKATLEGESSLPSPELLLTVDASLPFDPAGVLISHATHSAVHTQTLKDSNGCASVTGDLNTPVFVRAGSTMTVTIPINTDLVPGIPDMVKMDTSAPPPQSAPIPNHPNAPLASLTLDNNSGYEITHIRVANQQHEGVYSPYGPKIDLGKFKPGETRTISLAEGSYEIMYYSDHNKIVNKDDELVTSDRTINIPENDLGFISIDNKSGKNIEYLHFAVPGTFTDQFGGSLVSPSAPISSGSYVPFYFPTGTYDVVMRDSQATFYLRQITVLKDYSLWHRDTNLVLKETLPGVSLTVSNGGDRRICELRMIRYPDGDPGTSRPARASVNIFKYLEEDPEVVPGGTLTLKVEPGRYFMAAFDCSGNLLDERYPVEIRGDAHTYSPIKRCDTYGSVKIGQTESPIICPNPNVSSPTATFTQCYASAPIAAGPLSINICRNGSLLVTQGGTVLIDPDGYVYDEVHGIDAVIRGATVTCDVYDEDMDPWERWPAELYESQINPQVTGQAGYYAFFVPPGLYRVRAVAPKYDSHTSPDIRVIDEIVHYNIPMQGGGGGWLFLPMIER